MIGHEFRKFIIEEEYRITDEPITLGNPISNAVLVWIHQVHGNLVRTFNTSQTYVDKNYPWTGILATAVFVIHSKTRMQKGYSPGQLIFGRDMILLIKRKVRW